MGPSGFSETSVHTDQTMLRHIWEDDILQKLLRLCFNCLISEFLNFLPRTKHCLHYTIDRLIHFL